MIQVAAEERAQQVDGGAEYGSTRAEMYGDFGDDDDTEESVAQGRQ